MALENCPSCEKRISEKAKNCPKCGEPLVSGWVEAAVRKRWRARLQRLGIIVVGIIALAWFVGPTDRTSEPKNSIDELRKLAVVNAADGQSVHFSMFPDAWSLVVREGTLRCELGPVINGRARPLILFDAEGGTYALNGASLGSGKYLDGRSLEIDKKADTISSLIDVGLAMCEERERRECGTRVEALARTMTVVQQKLKNPQSADFVSSQLFVGMEECGKWRVRSAVDATNGFGATIRTFFTSEAHYHPSGQWITEVQFDK